MHVNAGIKNLDVVKKNTQTFGLGGKEQTDIRKNALIIYATTN
jgi:hypothetical protein